MEPERWLVVFAPTVGGQKVCGWRRGFPDLQADLRRFFYLRAVNVLIVGGGPLFAFTVDPLCSFTRADTDVSDSPAWCQQDICAQAVSLLARLRLAPAN